MPTARFYAFAGAAGCPTSGEVLPCLRSKNTTVLQRANYQVAQLAAPGMWYFLPVTDGSYIASLPSSQLEPANPVNGLRLLVGNNAHEGDAFVPTGIATEPDLLAWLAREFPSLPAATVSSSVLAQYPSGTPQERADDIYGEAQFVCASYWLADAFTSSSSSSSSCCSCNSSAGRKKAWHYQYSVPYASHGADLPAIFGPRGPNQAEGVALAMRRAWGRMLAEDDPGTGFEVW